MKILSGLTRECADPLTGAIGDYNPLLTDIGDATIVRIPDWLGPHSQIQL